MESRRTGLALLVVLAISGCAGAASDVYDGVIRYSSAHRGYVAVRKGGPTDVDHAPDVPPDPDDDRYVVLLHPVTRSKLRCSEDVTPYLPTLARAGSAPIEDHRARVTSLAILFPTTVAGGVLTGVGVTLLGLSLAPYFATRSDTPPHLYERGVTAFERGQDGEAIALLEQSAALDPAYARKGLGLYYLARAYHRAQRDAQSRIALTAFVDGAIVWNRPAYDEAERLLSELNSPPHTCASTAAVRIAWP